ncbi:hypothetical protein ACFL6U_08860 [Planctomycetota bacterium]
MVKKEKDILDQVLSILEHEYHSTHRDTYWEVFQHKVLLPILEGSPEPSLSELCEKFDLESAKKASNMIITVKRRFAIILRRALKEWELPDEDYDEDDDDNSHDFAKIL